MITDQKQRDIARASYDEAVQVTDAYRVQLQRRKAATHSDQAEKARRIEEAQAQLEAAERREYQAWDRLNHIHRMVISQAGIRA